eukprot:UC4_evm6s335
MSAGTSDYRTNEWEEKSVCTLVLLLCSIQATLGPRRFSLFATLSWFVQICSVVLVCTSFFTRNANPRFVDDPCEYTLETQLSGLGSASTNWKSNIYSAWQKNSYSFVPKLIHGSCDNAVLKTNLTCCNLVGTFYTTCFNGTQYCDDGTGCSCKRDQKWLDGQGRFKALKYSDIGNLLVAFSYVFSSFSGLLCGANFTGDIRNPGKDIPKGIYAAVFYGVSIFFVFSLLLGLSIQSLNRLPNDALDVILSLCDSKSNGLGTWAVLMGMSATVFATSVLHLISISTIIKHMCYDHAIPYIHTSEENDKRLSYLKRAWPTVYAFAIVEIFVLILEQDNTADLAVYITLTFFFVTALCNSCVLILTLLKVPSFRPRYKYYSVYTAAFGIIIPFMVSVGIDEWSTAFMLTFFILLTTLFSYKKFAANQDFSDLSLTISSFITARGLLYLNRKKATEKVQFVANGLVFIGNKSPAPLDEENNNLKCVERHLLLATNFKSAVSVIQVGYVHIAPFSREALLDKTQISNLWREFGEDRGLSFFMSSVLAPSLERGAESLISRSFIEKFDPNVLYLDIDQVPPSVLEIGIQSHLHLVVASYNYSNHGSGFHRRKNSHIRLPLQVGTQQSRKRKQKSDCDVILIAAPIIGLSSSLDINYSEFSNALKLALQLSYSYVGNSENLRVAVPSPTAAASATRQSWIDYLREIRIPAAVNVYIMNESRQWSLYESDISKEIPQSFPPGIPSINTEGFSSEDIQNFFCFLHPLQPELALTPLPDKRKDIVDHLREMSEGFASLLYIQANGDVIRPSLVL